MINTVLCVIAGYGGYRYGREVEHERYLDLHERYLALIDHIFGVDHREGGSDA